MEQDSAIKSKWCVLISSLQDAAATKTNSKAGCVTLPVAVVKYPGNLRKEGLILGPSWRVKSILTGSKSGRRLMHLVMLYQQSGRMHGWILILD